MDQNLRYGGEALFFIGVAVRVARWVFRTAQEVKVEPLFGGFPAAITTDQRTRMMAMINYPEPEAPAEVVHHCPKCGAQIHTDIIHGGLAPCRKCGWTATPAGPS